MTPTLRRICKTPSSIILLLARTFSEQETGSSRLASTMQLPVAFMCDPLISGGSLNVTMPGRTSFACGAHVANLQQQLRTLISRRKSQTFSKSRMTGYVAPHTGLHVSTQKHQSADEFLCYSIATTLQEGRGAGRPDARTTAQIRLRWTEQGHADT